MISESERAAYEGCQLPLMLCSVVDGHTHAEVVSDGLCRRFGMGREELYAALRAGLQNCTHPDDAAWLHTNTEDFINRRREELDVVFRDRSSPDEPYKMVHAVSRWQKMADGSEYALYAYFDMDATESAISRLFTQFADEQSDLIYTDPITGLKNFNYNRQFSMDHVERIRASGGIPMFMMLDIKGMQGYNQAFGYSNGDKLLRIVADELERARVHADGMVIRGNDDDFFVLDAFKGDEKAIAEKLDRINERIKDRAYGLTNGLRAGVCVMDADTRTTTAMDRARTALREIGDDMTVLCRFYSAEKDEIYWFRRYIIDNLDTALKENWIRVFYQPFVRTQTGKLVGLEALARWIDPRRGVIPPNDFIPLMSRFHQIWRLDLYMVEQVCREFAVRAEAGLPLLPVTVNFSAQDFDHVDIPAALDEIMGRYGLERDNIVIEITEQDLATGTEHFHEQLRALHARGFKLWLDDFGSGYSSLSIFSQFKIDRVKFDMELIRHLDDAGGANRRILRALNNVCRELGIRTLCEGVETQAQHDFLKEIDCEMAQGFLFHKPRPIEDSVFRAKNIGKSPTNFETKEERRALCDAWLNKGKES